MPIEGFGLGDSGLSLSNQHHQNLCEHLKCDFGIDFPISGGMGNSRDIAIIIHRQEPNDYTSSEHGILRCLGIGRKTEWKLLEQTLKDYNGRRLDQIKIETVKSTPDNRITQMENYCFDITECFERTQPDAVRINP